MDDTRCALIMQRWNVIQQELIPELQHDCGLTPKLEKLIHILEWVRIEEYLQGSWCGVGRPPHERAWLANAFVAKAILGITTTVGLIERLHVDRALKRICGFPMSKKLPSAATFSRAFDEFSQSRLAERVHEALVKEHLGDALIGHISRDATAIEANERPRMSASPEAPPAQTLLLEPEASKATEDKKPKRRSRGRLSGKQTIVSEQLGKPLNELLAEIPRACDRGTKCNAQGYKVSWNGYKLHIDTADCGVPISAMLSSASMHDVRAAIPLSLMSKERVTNLYDVMDAAYCSTELREHCRSLGHVPLIDHNPRGGKKIEFNSHEAVRYNERTVAERMNARLKREFGGEHVMVRSAEKVMNHLMFGLLALSADQLMRLHL
jgi:IS5 family transposase